MSRLVVDQFLSLDGVVQAPGTRYEDPDGFEHGGWTQPYMADHAAGMVAAFESAGGLLLGRRTYEIFAGHWPKAHGPLAAKLNALPKWVASTTLERPAWTATTLLSPDVPEAVAELKSRPGPDLLVVASAGLSQTLMVHDLVDVYRLWLHPVVLGPGKRLFRGDGAMQALTLTSTDVTPTGVVVPTLEPSRTEAPPVAAAA